MFGGPAKKAERLDAVLRELKDAQKELEDLRRQFQRWQLQSQAMWDLVKTRSGLDDKDLLEAVAQLEKTVGELPHDVNFCSHCGRVVQKNRRTCLYCESPVEGQVAF